MSNSFRPRGLQHARLSCPPSTPGVCSNSCPWSWWLPSNHLILGRPLLLLPSIFPSIGVFSSESVLHIRWPKYWSFSFSFSISPSSEYSGLISFRIDCFDLLAVRGTLKSLLQQLISIYKQLIFTASDCARYFFSLYMHMLHLIMLTIQWGRYSSPLSCTSAVSLIRGQSKSRNIE